MQPWVGGVLGLIVGIVLFIAVPMYRNYAECGTVFLCHSPR